MSQEFYFKKYFLFAFIAAFLVSCSSTAKYNISYGNQGGVVGKISSVKVVNPKTIEVKTRVKNKSGLKFKRTPSCSVKLFDAGKNYMGRSDIKTHWYYSDEKIYNGTQLVQISDDGAEYITEVEFYCSR